MRDQKCTHTHTHSPFHPSHTHPSPTPGHKVEVVDDYDKIEMVRTMGTDGMAEEEYNFNSEVSLGLQVHIDYFCWYCISFLC